MLSAQPIDPTRPVEIALPLMKNAPAIDGVIDDKEWRDAARIPGFTVYLAGLLDPRSGEAWFGCDGKRVYIAWRTETPTVGALLTNVTKHDAGVDSDDAVELILHPHYGKTNGEHKYFQFIGNPLGTIFDIAHDAKGPQTSWDGDWQFKNRIANGFWESEASVSLESLNATEEDLKREWRVRVARDWKEPFLYTSWSLASSGGFFNPETMTRVRFDAAAPVTQIISLGDVTGNKLDAKVSVRNPGATPMTLKVSIEAQPSNQPWMKEEKQLTLAGGEEQIVSLKRDLWPVKHCGEIIVANADGAKVFLRRSFAWEPSTKPKWTTIQKELKPVDFTTAYFPYYKKLRAKIDLIGLKSWANVRKANLKLTAQNSAQVLASGTASTFKDGKAEIVLDTPDLKTGSYVATLSLEGGEGVPTEAFTQTFNRHVYEWEHNVIGKSALVIPPFTPLQVKKNNVEAVLRSHAMNGFGVWDQVVATGKNVLAAPMRFEASVANQKVALRSGKLKYFERKPNSVKSRTSFEGGPVKAGVLCEWDYDGMMKVTLDLAATNGKLDNLDLLIPLRADIASLMHASSDGVRSNPSGAIPAGSGVVWDSSKMVRYNTYGTWIPYIWLGGSERGVCWFSDSDKDWSLDDKKPALDIVRDGNAITLRVHLLNTSTLLNRARKIVFGLQATPVKPLPKDWRKWTFFAPPAGAKGLTVLGQGQYWGAATGYNDVYPRGRDFAVIDKISQARNTGKPDADFVSEWVKGYADQSPERVADYAKDVGYGLRSAASVQGAPLIIYTNPRGGGSGPEAKEFDAEGFNSAPSESYRDFALFYFKKMMEHGINGIYLDNTYFQSDSNMISGGAYVREDGTIQPGVGLFAMRELVKRIAVMYWENGKMPYTVAHMTNGNIIPVLSFATLSLDHEDKYGATDFQDRFSNDFLLTESTGIQAGLVPMTIGGALSNDEKERTWVSRTIFGVAAVHEIKPWAYFDAGEIMRGSAPMYQFGYGEPDLKAYRYWENQPIILSRNDAKALVLSRPGKAMIIVTDFGNGGEISIQLDAARLGLKTIRSAKDAQSGEPVSLTGNQLKVLLPKHDYRMIVVE